MLNDEGVVDGVATHVGQGRDLDGAGGQELRHRVGLHHVVQRVVEGPQVGIDLVVQGARQETQPLPGLDRRAGQDDAAHLFGLQGLHRLRHGQVGLASVRRADSENHRVPVDGIHVAFLVEGLRPHGPAARGDDVGGEDLGGFQVLGGQVPYQVGRRR